MATTETSGGNGSLIGGIIGATIGWFMGGWKGAVKGWVYGSSIGGFLDPPDGPHLIGPRLDDLNIQTSSVVADLGRAYGLCCSEGNIIWAQGNKLQEVVTTTTKKKKLLGFTVSKQKTTTYTYYLNCAISIALIPEGANVVMLRVWVGDKLVYNPTNSDAGTVLATSNFEEFMTIRPGTDDQEIFQPMADDVGDENCSAYPALFYVGITDLDLTPWNDDMGRARFKFEYCVNGADATDIEFMSQAPVPLHPSYVENWDFNYFDIEGLHAWKWGSAIALEGDYADTTYSPHTPTDFDKLHYVAIPGSDTMILKEIIKDIIPSAYTVNPSTADRDELKGFRHVAKGKSDINAAVFVTAFMKTNGDADGGGYPGDPRMFQPGVWIVQEHQPVPGPEFEFDTYYDAWQYIISDPGYGTVYSEADFIDPLMWVDITTDEGFWYGRSWRVNPEGHVFDYPKFSVWLRDFDEPPMPLPPPSAEDFNWTGGNAIVQASITVVMPGWHKEYKKYLPSVPSSTESHYVIYDGDLYWAYDGGIATYVYKIRVDGATVDSTAVTDVSNNVTLVRIGVVDHQLVIITRIGVTASMRICNVDDFTTFTDYDSADILAEFGFTDMDFCNNTSMDFDRFIYFDDPNVYMKTSFLATPVLLGDADGDLIGGEARSNFFNMWKRGSLLAVSTFEEDGIEACAQFFTVGMVGEPAMADLADILQTESALTPLDDGDLNTDLVDQQVRGYRIAKRGAVKNTVVQLQALYPFDVIESGYQIKIVPRGQEPVATVTWEDLGEGDQFSLEIAMETTLPRKVILRFFNPDMEYEIDEQFSERPINSLTEHVIDIPATFYADEGAQIADVIQGVYILEKISYTGFQLPPYMRYIEPADVINVQLQDVTYEVRMTNMQNQINGAFACEGKPNDLATYDSTAKGSVVVRPPDTIPVPSGSSTILMDLPLIGIEDYPGFWAVMASVFENWTGGELLKQTSNIWTAVQAFAGNCTFGVCSTVLSEHGCHLVDRGSTLTVKLQVGAIASVSDADFYNEEFLVAYGAAGRWEIMALKNATNSGGNVFVVDTMLRGLRGTEWTTGLHQVNDYFVSLNDVDNAFIEVLEAEIGQTLIYRGVGKGGDVSASFDLPIDYDGENLLPRSPAYVRARADGDDVIFTIVRRDRAGPSWIDDEEIPMSEAEKSFIIEIYSGVAQESTLLRTLSFTTEYDEDDEVTYTEAMQIEDFGDATYDYPGIVARQVSAKVGRGRAWIGEVSTAFALHDPLWANVVFLHKPSGVNGATTGAVDLSSSPVTLTFNGGASISTSVLINGQPTVRVASQGGLSAPTAAKLGLGTGNFCIEQRVILDSGISGSDRPIIDTRTSGSSNAMFMLRNGQTGSLYNGGFVPASATGATPSSSVEVFLCWERVSGVLYFSIDGVVQWSTAYTGDFSTTRPIYLYRNFANSSYTPGNYGETRITNVARYGGANFTPPAAFIVG